METENLKRNSEETLDETHESSDENSSKRLRQNETVGLDEEDHDTERPCSAKQGGSDQENAEQSDNSSNISSGDQDLIANIVADCYLSQKLLEDLTPVLETPPVKYGPNINEAIVSQWSYITKNGLNTECKEKILSKSLIPENCQFLRAPILNTEIRAMLSEKLAKKDDIFYRIQNNLGEAMASVALALNTLLQDKNNTIAISKHISDAGRLLCNLFHQESSARRDIVSRALPKEDRMKLLSETVIGKHLYGDNNLIEILLNLNPEKAPDQGNETAEMKQHANKLAKLKQQQNRPGNFRQQQNRPGNYKQQYFGPGKFRQQYNGPSKWQNQHYGPANWQNQHNGPAKWQNQHDGPVKWQNKHNGPTKWQNKHNGPTKWQNKHNGPAKWQNQHNGSAKWQNKCGPPKWQNQHDEPAEWQNQHDEPAEWQNEHDEPAEWQNEHDGPAEWQNEHDGPAEWQNQNNSPPNFKQKQFVYTFDSDDDSDST